MRKGGANMNRLRLKLKEEKGNFTLMTLVVMIGIIVFAGLFINLTMTYLTINFSKKAMEEATRTRALAVDIVMKENYGVIETITNPYITNEFSDLRQPLDFLGRTMVGVENQNYKDAVQYAETSAKNTMIMTVDNYVGNTAGGEKMIDMTEENICFDIKPLQDVEQPVTFSCAVKTNEGKIYTVEATIPVLGYDDITEINNFDDGANGKVRVSNVVFGAAVVSPKSLIRNSLRSLGFVDEPETIIYSVAYPQIDSCYGEFC